MTTSSRLDPALARWLDSITATGKALARLQGNAPERVRVLDAVIADYVRALGREGCLNCAGRVDTTIEHEPPGCAGCPFRPSAGPVSANRQVCFMSVAVDSAGVQHNLQRLARLFLDPDAGSLACQRFREGMAGLRAEAADSAPSVLCLVTGSREGVQVVGGQTYWQGILDAMGVRNWAAGLSDYLPLEQLTGIQGQPDRLLVLESHPGEFISARWPVLRQLEAWNKGRTLYLEKAGLSAWGPALPRRLSLARAQLME